MWALLALGAAVLAPFNPMLYKRMLKDAAPMFQAKALPSREGWGEVTRPNILRRAE
jgi:hypothetical protein